MPAHRLLSKAAFVVLDGATNTPFIGVVSKNYQSTRCCQASRKLTLVFFRQREKGHKING
ncbi:MAG: hypothetical protein EAY75_16475 [Bacteroidetes bacterium]|nr:MAG: hypothetical protein EAY75_16475 [Bacteroidota bacterium]